MIAQTSPYDALGYAVLKVETHLHTRHSDGRDTVAAMFEACRAAGYDAVALTDHNTQSGLDEAQRAADALGLIVVPGVEVTTFRGHAIVLGVRRVPEWRDLDQRGIDDLARGVHADGGLVCVAHAAALGSPVCSGCTWDWPFEPTSVDLWEVFSAPRPIAETLVAEWQQLLERGGRACPAAAGDVHSVEAAAQPRRATHVYVRERTPDAVLQALRERRVFTSDGPRLDFWLEDDAGNLALAGEQVAAGAWTPRGDRATGIVALTTADGSRCLYAERRDDAQVLEAISAPIWIETSH